LLLASLNTTQTISIAVGGIVTLGVLVAIFNVWTSFIHERRRTQPIAISHEYHGRRFTDKSDYFAVGGYLTNEGGGPAFNVRFGVEFGGVRYPQKMYPDDPDAGNVQRVLRPGERRPYGDTKPDSWPILIPALALIGTESGDELDRSRVYWARYENARGQTWETTNPWERSARLHIRRVRAVGLREKSEQRRRVRAGASGAAWEAQALAELREVGRKEAIRRGPIPDEDGEQTGTPGDP
jgi:hypothetical protein